MDFELSSEQKEIRDLALKFSKNEIIPVALEYDQESTFPTEIFKKAWEIGLINTSIPPEFGGAGFSTLDSMIITEGLSYGCMGMNSSFMANDLALLPIVVGASDEQKKKFLSPFAESFKIASFCLTEPGNGSDAGGLKTTIKEESDHFVVNGEKMWITNAGYADLFTIYATHDTSKKHKGICAIVLEKGNYEGDIEIGKPEKKMGHNASDTRAIRFNNVRIPKENLLGDLGDGWKIAMQTLDHSRPMVAASAVGGAQRALDLSVEYAKERKQFGTEISNFQAIQFMISDMAMEIEAARLLVHKAAWSCDQKIPNTKLASYAKAFSTDTCMKVTTNAVQIYGGYGYSKEYPVEKLMRDAKLLQIYEGTSQIQRLVIAKEIFKRS